MYGFKEDAYNEFLEGASEKYGSKKKKKDRDSVESIERNAAGHRVDHDRGKESRGFSIID